MSNQIQYVVYKMPTKQEEVEDLSAELTLEYGSEGFELISTTVMPNGDLLIGLMRKN